MKRRKRREKLFVGMAFILCIGLVAMLFSINRKEKTDSIFCRGLDYMGNAMAFFQTPGLYLVMEKNEHSILEFVEERILFGYPLYLCSLKQVQETRYQESAILDQMWLVYEDDETEDEVIQEPEKDEGNEKEEPSQTPDAEKEDTQLWQGDLSADEEAIYPINSIRNYELALETFYQVDSTTVLERDLLNVEEFLEKDMTLSENIQGPQILIYHTHSQEGYAGSDKTVVDVGNVLTALLEEKYGIEVLHHTAEYDAQSRDNAYSLALPDLMNLLEQYPTIEVVIDLHRDGVGENVHLVTTIDGKPVAKLMFFNGISRTRKNGELPHLENPHLKDNLAFSFQMHLAAKTYYPDLMRDIYIKGYRYNLHLMPKSLLVEVGAQTNTYEEAANAMTYLAEILYRVLKIKR